MIKKKNLQEIIIKTDAKIIVQIKIEHTMQLKKINY